MAQSTNPVPNSPSEIRPLLIGAPVSYLLRSDSRILGSKAFGVAFRIDAGTLLAAAKASVER